MGDILHVRLPLAPQHKGRPSCACKRTKDGRVFPTVYTDTQAKRWMKDAALLIRGAWRQAPMNGPVRVTIIFVKRRIASRPIPSNKDARALGHWYVTPEAWKGGRRVPAATIPDIDNMLKATLDAISQASVWHDDAQVASLQTSKWYAAKGEDPCVEIRVEPL